MNQYFHVNTYNRLIINMSIFIPLGSSCGVAYQLNKLNIRRFSYPFDWLRIGDLNQITQCISNDFKDFVQSDMKVITRSIKFPTFDTDNFPDSTIIDKKISIIKENCYGMKFYHDFSQKVSYEHVLSKYERRILRFTDMIKNNK